MDRLTKQTKRTRSTQRDQGETQNVAEEDIAQSCQDPSLSQQQDTLEAVGRKRRQRTDAPGKHEHPNVLGKRVLGGNDPQGADEEAAYEVGREGAPGKGWRQEAMGKRRETVAKQRAKASAERDPEKLNHAVVRESTVLLH